MELDVRGDVTGLDLRLARGRTIQGRVVFLGADPPARERTVTIQAEPEPSQFSWDRGMPRARSGPDMRFDLSEVFARPRMAIAPQAPAGWVVELVRFGRRDITDRYVDLTAGEPGDQLEIALTNRTARAKIRALDNGREPVTTFRTLVLPRDPDRWAAAFWRCLALTPTRDGVAVLEMLPGEYLVAAIEVNASMTFGWNGVPDVSSIAARAVHVTLSAGDNATTDVPLIDISGGRR